MVLFMVSINEVETESIILGHVPKKRNIAFEALKSVVISVGVVFGVSAIAGKAIRDNLESKAKMIGLFGGLSGAYNIYQAVKYNKQVDEFTTRLEQEQAAKFVAPSAPAARSV